MNPSLDLFVSSAFLSRLCLRRYPRYPSSYDHRLVFKFISQPRWFSAVWHWVINDIYFSRCFWDLLSTFYKYYTKILESFQILTFLKFHLAEVAGIEPTLFESKSNVLNHYTTPQYGGGWRTWTATRRVRVSDATNYINPLYLTCEFGAQGFVGRQWTLHYVPLAARRLYLAWRPCRWISIVINNTPPLVSPTRFERVTTWLMVPEARIWTCILHEYSNLLS